jgi:Uma2 family endonuclease
MASVARGSQLSQADVCFAFRGVGWSGLQHMKAVVGERPMRITYARGDLLLMSPGPAHEAYVEVFSDLVKSVGRAFRIPTRSLRSTLWERPTADAGKMPDAAFYVASVGRVGDRIPKVETDPVPDLVIEVEISNPVELALQAYAGLGVPEVWHFARRSRRPASLRFLRLAGGLWSPSAVSEALPMLESAKVLPLVERAVTLNDLDRADLIEDWIRDDLRHGRRRRPR